MRRRLAWVLVFVALLTAGLATAAGASFPWSDPCCGVPSLGVGG